VPGYTEKQKLEIAEQLAQAYRQGEAEILRKLAQGNLSEWSTAFANNQLAQIRGVLSQLDAATAKWAQAHLPGLYAEGAKVVDSYLPALGEFTFSRLHAEAIELIGANLQQRMGAATAMVGRQAEDAFRRAALQGIQQGLIQGDTTRTVSKTILADLRQQGITAFVTKPDASGVTRTWNLENYASMVARTTTAEAEIQGTVNRTLEAGEDLVEVDSHAEPCELCAAWEGRVLSLTGNTPGYPTLEEAEAEGFLHPNCLHSLLPYAGDEPAAMAEGNTRVGGRLLANEA